MANTQFDRLIISSRERPLSSDINQLQSQSDRTIREVMKSLYAPRTSTLVDSSSFVPGFVGDGYKVRAAAAPDMTVTVTSGLGFYENPGDEPATIGGIIGLDDRCSYKPFTLVSPAVFHVPAVPSAGNERWDIIEVKVDRRAENPLVRETFDPVSSAFVAGLVNKTLAFAHDGRTNDGAPVIFPAGSTKGLSYVQGIEAAIGAASVPTVTSGYVKIAEVYTKDTTTVIPAGNINDCRRMLFPGGVGHITVTFQQNTGGAVPTLLQVNGPPGIEVTVGAVGPLGGSIYVKAGGSLAASLPGSAQFYPTAWGGAVVAPGSPHQLSTGLVADMANAALVSNVMYWGHYQWVSWWNYRLYNGDTVGIGKVQANTEAGIVSVDLTLSY